MTGRDFFVKELPVQTVGCEVGVWEGGMAAAMLEVANPTKLILVDPWVWDLDGLTTDIYLPRRTPGGQHGMDKIYKTVCARFEEDKRVEIMRLRSVEAAKLIPDDHLDWIYIDGAHNYENVKADFQAWKHKVKVGGLLCGDDYTWGAKYGHPVKKAVHEFLDTEDFEKVLINELYNKIILKRLS